ncbi:ATP-binding protein [Cohnella sp. REN36]|uniref:ATP-binding protein n=1 Tax=Cohnella sp. REN36 TaxID=2887347 RepID=UPI001D13A0E4|nr:ATP-binding protein [Cohnella sp. REN36]MCC3377616.1 PAS domain-containing sensor histidine kinase [Cohnella sp. REN36]
MTEETLARRSGTGRTADTRNRQDKYAKRFAERMLADEGTGVLLLDADFRIVEANPMVCCVFDSARSDLIGMTVEALFELCSVPPPFGRSLLSGEAFRNRRMVWGEGDRTRELMLDGDVLRDDAETIGAYVLFRDVSELMVLEEQVRRADRLKMIGQIAAGTAHEIRNPLTAIKGFMQLLLKSLTERCMGREQEFVAIVLSELDRVHELVNEFLLLSKSKETRLEPIRIGRILQEMLPMLRNEAMLHDIALRYEPRPDLPLVLADKEMLKQVFLNLGKNAIEAMGKGGSLIIRERRGDVRHGQVSVDICDTGTGIPPELVDRVFDPFFTTKEQGTGLGLSICQRIVHDLGGHIDVTSSSEGTVFTVSVPFVGLQSAGMASGGGALPLDDV